MRPILFPNERFHSPLPSAGRSALHGAEAPPGATLAIHCEEEEYAAFLDRLSIGHAFRKQRLQHRRRFVARWARLEGWLAAPMDERVGRLSGERRTRLSYRVSYQARSYLYYLALTDRLRLDLDWMLAVGDLHVLDVARSLGTDLGIEEMTNTLTRLGFNASASRLSMLWTLSRIALRFGVRTPAGLDAGHVDDMLAAIRRFGERTDVGMFWGSAERYRVSPAKAWITRVTQLRVALYHRGQVAVLPPKAMPPYAYRPAVQPEMRAVVDRWLAVRRLTLRPNTIYHREISLRRFLEYLATAAPAIRSFAEVTRDHVVGFLAAMANDVQPTTGRRLSIQTRRGRASDLAMFFRDLFALGWEGPSRPLLDHRDKPRQVHRVPRFIPENELARIMAVIASMPCPYQRAALLILRWSGARRGEVRRLALDCLDRYPDGTHRLRIPAGKTFKERIVPLHDEAASALTALAELRRNEPDRPLIDELTGDRVRYLFVTHGKLLSTAYLFKTPLQRACQDASLVDAAGRGTISAHRFRHTLGTQLAERGAKLDTIMSVLGHQSPTMSMVYARISDPEVLRDYQAVLAPGAVIAGPGAEAVRGGAMSASAVDWLKTNTLQDRT